MPGKRELKTEKTPKLWLIPACAGAALVGVYAGFCIAAAAGDSIAPHTVVGGQDVGGMSRTEATAAIDSALDGLRTRSGVHATLEDGEEVVFLTYDELGVTFDAAELADEAYTSSYSDNPFSDGWKLLTAALGRQTVVTPEPDASWTDRASEKLAEAGALTPEDFSYEIESADTLLLTKARDGRDPDRVTLKARLDDAEADEAGSRTVVLPYTAIAADPGDLAALNESLGGEAANAKYDVETQTIIPERPALSFDVAQAQMLLNAAAPGAQVRVPAEASEPQVTAEELKKVLFRDVLGTYTTKVGGAAGRKANVKLTAQRVNGTVLNSGDVFDYYTLCGPFSAANGYQSAPGYLHGKTVDMDGGGACQCSSTTYAAALLANLEIVARTNHGFASDYIGLGLDATVSGGGPEFQFRNNTAYPIKVETIYSANNRLTVNILGTKTDDTTVKMRTEVLSTTPYEEEIVEDPELAPGERIVDQTPYTGYVVNTYRQLYDGQGNLISETLEARSRYNKRNRIIHVGPGLPEDENGETPADVPLPVEVPQETPTTPVVEPAPVEPTELPGGVTPTPIEEQLNQLGNSEAETTGV